jgi:hypothetical protein
MTEKHLKEELINLETWKLVQRTNCLTRHVLAFLHISLACNSTFHLSDHCFNYNSVAMYSGVMQAVQMYCSLQVKLTANKQSRIDTDLSELIAILRQYIRSYVRELRRHYPFHWNWKSRNAGPLQQFQFKFLTNSMEQCVYWESDGRLPSQEFPLVLWNPNVHYSVHKSSPSNPQWDECRPHLHTLFLKINFNVVPSVLRSIQWFLPFGFSD